MVRGILTACLPRQYFDQECTVLCSHIFVSGGASIEAWMVLHVWVSSGSSPEVCGHFALLCVCHIHMYGTFQDHSKLRGILSQCLHT